MGLLFVEALGSGDRTVLDCSDVALEGAKDCIIEG